MKKNKIIQFALALWLALISHGVWAQDADINILFQPASIQLNGFGQIQVDICNNDPGSALMPSYKLRPLISVPSSIAVITGVTGLPAGWSICSNTGSSIRLTNGTDNFPPGECRTFFIDVQGIAVGGPQVITATLGFGGGTSATACNNGPQTAGNLTANDNSTTSVTVISILPITLQSFTVAANNCTANLNWVTASEINASRFEIEMRTTDNATYNKVGSVFATAAGGGGKAYNFTFPMQSDVRYYFRLKMIDKDGSFKYSAVRTVSCGNKSGVLINPNPVLDKFTISGMENGMNTIVILSASGQQVKKCIISQSQGNINIQALASGVYFVRIINENGTVKVSKIIKN